MKLSRLLTFAFAVLSAGLLHAETPEELAKKTFITMTLNDVPPGAVLHFVEVVAKLKINYQGYPGDQTLLSVNFENVSADEALKYVANLAKLELAYKADGAYFTPKK